MSTSSGPGSADHKSRSALRARLRERRRNLSPARRKDADMRICRNLRCVPAVRRAGTIAAYLSFDGEPSLEHLFEHSAQQFVVPVVQAQRMTFTPLNTQQQMMTNRFGIAEPKQRVHVPARFIDIVLVPVVGFDASGNRLGMGGGFYDRFFNYLITRKYYRRPRLIGVAYEMQCVDKIPHQTWDVPLWGIVTEQNFRTSVKESRH